MTDLARADVRPALAMGRTFGASLLALGILLGVGGTLRPAEAASIADTTHAVVTGEAIDRGGIVPVGHKYKRGYGYKHGVPIIDRGFGFKRSPGFKSFHLGHGKRFYKHGFGHGRGFKTFGFKHGHGFKKGFKHPHGFKHGHGFKKGFKHSHRFKHGKGGKVIFF